jgi:hypothetical protein
MSYMSWHETTTAARWWRSHPVLGPATATLAALCDASDRFPEGWLYSGAPARAGSALAGLIQGGDDARYDRPDAAAEALRAALHPVLEFRAAHGLDFPVTSAPPASADVTPQPGGSRGHGRSRLPASGDPVHGNVTDGTPARPDRPGTAHAPEVS